MALAFVAVRASGAQNDERPRVSIAVVGIHPLFSFSVGAHIFGVRGTVDDGRDISATGLWTTFSLGVAVR